MSCMDARLCGWCTMTSSVLDTRHRDKIRQRGRRWQSSSVGTRSNKSAKAYKLWEREYNNFSEC